MADSRTVTLAIVGVLNNAPSLNDYTILSAYTPYEKPFPLKKPTVAVGCDSFVEKRGDVYSQSGSHQLLYNRAIDVRIGFDIYVPQKQFGYVCNTVFDNISNYLLDNNTFYNYVSVGCGKVVYKRDENAFLLHGWVDIEIRRTV